MRKFILLICLLGAACAVWRGPAATLPATTQSIPASTPGTPTSVAPMERRVAHSTLGFSVAVPVGWEVTETEDGLTLQHNTLQLIISDGPPPPGLPAGELVQEATIRITGGLSLRRESVVNGGQTTFLFYTVDGVPQVPLGNFNLFIRAEDANITANHKAVLDEIIRTLRSE